MFGRHPRIAVDVALGRHESEFGSDYVKKLKEQLRKAYEMAEKNSRNSQGDQKKFYDRKVRGAVLAPGDRVLVRKVGLKGMQKLADRWSEEVYVVIDQPNSDIPVYRVKLEVGRSAVKTLHRNLLLPLCALPVVNKPIPRARRSITPIKSITPDISGSDGSDNEASSEDGSILVVRRSQPRRSSAASVAADGQVDVLDSDSVLNEMVSRSVIDEDVELQVPSVDTDETSLDINQNDLSHEMRVTSDSGDLNVPDSSDLAGIECNSSNQSDMLQLTLKFLVLVMAVLNQMKLFLTLRFLVLVILSLLEPHQFRHQEGRVEFGIRVI